MKAAATQPCPSCSGRGGRFVPDGWGCVDWDPCDCVAHLRGHGDDATEAHRISAGATCDLCFEARTGHPPREYDYGPPPVCHECGGVEACDERCTELADLEQPGAKCGDACGHCGRCS
jgi:hypothetical protein